MKKRLVILISVVAIAIILAVCAAVLSHYLEYHSDERLIYYNGTQYRYRDDISTFLVIGIDDNDNEEESSLGEYYRNTSQSDFLMLVVFDESTHTYRIIQINRDTMADIHVYDRLGDYAGDELVQIALSHTYGSGAEDSCENTVYAVSHLLYDAKIDNYMSITTDVVPVLNDLAGGVDVLVEDDFEGVDDTLVMGQTVHLEGQHALVYIRARRAMADDSNEARMRRQNTYLLALREALMNAFIEDPSFAVSAYSAVMDHTVTDVDFDDIPGLAYKLATYEFEGVVGIEGESVAEERYAAFYPDESALQELIISSFYEPVE